LVFKCRFKPKLALKTDLNLMCCILYTSFKQSLEFASSVSDGRNIVQEPCTSHTETQISTPSPGCGYVAQHKIHLGRMQTTAEARSSAMTSHMLAHISLL